MNIVCHAMMACVYIGSQNLEEVLGTLVQGAVGFPDPAVSSIRSVGTEQL